jgi:predicted SnoaL-like aldol condensation-catalyzing enzyme
MTSARQDATFAGKVNAKMITGQASSSTQQLVMRYFDMWNGGNPTVAHDILHQEWIDHAHPEVSGPADVQRAVERIRTAQPNLRFVIHTLLGDGDLVAAVGEVVAPSGPATTASRLIWLVRIQDGRMAEMWTYRHSTP